MSSLVRNVLPAAMLACSLVATASGRSLQAGQGKEPTGSISGRVTLGDKPAAGVNVILAPSDHGPVENSLPKTTTDEAGHFQLTRVPAGSYMLQTFTPAFVTPGDDMRGNSGKMINLSDGETVEGIDIGLVRGGVITGRVTDGSGQPLIQEGVRLTPLDESGKKLRGNISYFNLPYGFMMTTDDRGVYRLFGVPPGRYIVSAGVDTRRGYTGAGNVPSYYPITYHPDVADDSRATVIEVTSGGETTGVDIVLGRSARTYSATGRIVDAETGRPVPGLDFGYGTLQPNSTNFSYSLSTGAASNVRGEFRFQGILPGRYAAFATSREETSWYSEPVMFQIADADVAGLEIKMHHGATMNGVVVMEGGNDQGGAPKLSDLRLGVYVASQSMTSPRSSPPLNVGPDGSFRATGLQAGKAMVYLATYPEPSGVSVLRIERDGVEQPEGIEIGAREQVSGVRVVLGYATGSISGQARIEGGPLPEGLRLIVSCHPVSSDSRQNMPQVLPDARGRFVIKGLMDGEYQVELSVYSNPGAAPPRLKPVKQIVSVANGSDTQVVLTISFDEKQQ
jgi:hypothetical protein